LWIRRVSERTIDVPLRGAVVLKAVGGEDARDTENDYGQRSDTPPVLIEGVEAVAALESDAEDAEQHESRAQD
jgi:hypothetical protein